MQLLSARKDKTLFKKNSILARLSPAQVLVLGFAAVILIGALLLTLPVVTS